MNIRWNIFECHATYTGRAVGSFRAVTCSKGILSTVIRILELYPFTSGSHWKGVALDMYDQASGVKYETCVVGANKNADYNSRPKSRSLGTWGVRPVPNVFSGYGF